MGARGHRFGKRPDGPEESAFEVTPEPAANGLWGWGDLVTPPPGGPFRPDSAAPPLRITPSLRNRSRNAILWGPDAPMPTE